MTLNIALRSLLRSGAWLWDNFTNFDLGQLIRACAFDADTLCHAVTLAFDPLTLKVRDTASVK